MFKILLLTAAAILVISVSSTYAVKCHSCSAMYHESAIGGLTYHDTCSDKTKWVEQNCDVAPFDHCLYYSLNATVGGLTQYLVSRGCASSDFCKLNLTSPITQEAKCTVCSTDYCNKNSAASLVVSIMTLLACIFLIPKLG